MEEPVEIYGKWISIKKDHETGQLVICLERDEEMKSDFIDFLNNVFFNKDIGLKIRILENYRGIKNSFKDRSQSRLIWIK